MRKGSAQTIGDVLKNVIGQLSQAKVKDIAKILSSWTAIVGKELARHTKPAGLRKGTLQVFVDDSCWFYQANLQKEQLLQALKKKIGEKKVQEIRFRIGNIKKRWRKKRKKLQKKKRFL